MGALLDHVRSYYSALNSGDPDRVASHFSDDAIHYYTRRELHRGARTIGEHTKWAVEMIGGRWFVENGIEEGDQACIEWTMTWHHPETKETRLDRGAEWFLFRDGKIAEVRAYFHSDHKNRSGDLVGFDHAGRGHTVLSAELTSIAAVTQMPQLTGVEHRFVDAGGLRTHVAEAGEGDPLVLLHGWPQHWYMWRRVIPELAKRYRVIAPDLRGFGWSDAPDHGYEKENMADDVVHLLDALGLDRVRLAGHDWGGWIGFLLCLRNPERVDRYLALNIPPPWGEISARGALDLWRFWYQVVMAAPGLGSRLLEDRPHFFKRLLRYSVNNPSTWTDRELNVFLKPLREPARARASSLIYRTWLLNELVPIIGGRYRSSRLTTPTLLLFGTHDKAITPRMIRGYEPYADDLRVEFVESSGHFIAEEVPQLVLDRALEFFAADDGRAASAAAEATGA